jgi:hypothetical protein
VLWQVIKKSHPNEEASQRMAYGTLHELDAIATLTGKVLPFLYPNLSYFEGGCKIIPCPTDDSFMVLSPDSSLRAGQDQIPSLLYENKCKSPTAFSPTRVL